jgi:hypothetical protein
LAKLAHNFGAFCNTTKPEPRRWRLLLRLIVL